MKKIILLIILNFIVWFNSHSILNAEEKNYKIIKLVNDQIITNYDLEQRLKLYSTLNNLNVNEKNIDRLAYEMLNLMVDERLQAEQINLYKISISESQVNNYIDQAYLNDDDKLNDFINSLNKNNIDIDIFKKSIKIMLGWNELSSRLYFRTSEISNIDLKNLMKENSSLSEDQAENILLQKQIELRARKLLRDIRAEANIENR